MTTRQARRIRAAVVAVIRWERMTARVFDGSVSMQGIRGMSARYQVTDIFRMPYGQKVLEIRMMR